MYEFEKESLLIGSDPSKSSLLLKWLDDGALRKLTRAYYEQIQGPSGRGRACGFISPDTFVLFRTHKNAMERYCQRMREALSGTVTCPVSDYFGAATAIRLQRPLAYCCGGLVYDYTIPLYTTNDRTIGVFIDGQMRPDPPLLADILYLRDRFHLPHQLIREYMEVAPLTSDRVRTISGYLKNDFVKLLEELGCEKQGERLNTDRFQEDVDNLEKCLSHLAVRRPLETVWLALDQDSPVNLRPAMVPVTSMADTYAVDGDRDYAFVSFMHPSGLGVLADPTHMHHLAVTRISSLEKGALEAICDLTVKAENSTIDEASEEAKALYEFGEAFRESLYAPFRAIQVARTGKSVSSPKKTEANWRYFPSSYNGEYCMLSVCLYNEDLNNGDMFDAACDASKAIGSYLERCSIARRIWGALGDTTLSPADQQSRIRDVSARVKSLYDTAGSRPHLAKWKRLLGALRVELDEYSFQNRPPDSLNRDAANWLATTVGSPIYDSAAVTQCEVFLSQRPFSSKVREGTTVEYGTQNLEASRRGITRKQVKEDLQKLLTVFHRIQDGG